MSTQKKLLSLTSIALILVLTSLSACSKAMVSKEPKLAVLVESSPANTQAIQQAMSTALNGKQITLASSAFLNSPTHTLERKQLKNLNAKTIDGLILGIPEVHRFSLYSSGKNCYLVYAKNEKKYPLKQLKCQPL